MKIIGERENVRGVAERWKRQYFYDNENRWGKTISGDTEIVYKKLAELNPETATASEVAAIVGNNSWAGPSNCDECGETVDRTVRIGQPPDYESSTAEICESCIRKALSLFEQR